MQPHSTSPPTPEEIEICAYLIWHLEGRPDGRALEHWVQAKAQLFAAHYHEESVPPAREPHLAGEPAPTAS